MVKDTPSSYMEMSRNNNLCRPIATCVGGDLEPEYNFPPPFGVYPRPTTTNGVINGTTRLRTSPTTYKSSASSRKPKAPSRSKLEKSISASSKGEEMPALVSEKPDVSTADISATIMDDGASQQLGQIRDAVNELTNALRKSVVGSKHLANLREGDEESTSSGEIPLNKRSLKLSPRTLDEISTRVSEKIASDVLASILHQLDQRGIPKIPPTSATNHRRSKSGNIIDQQVAKAAPARPEVHTYGYFPRNATAAGGNTLLSNNTLLSSSTLLPNNTLLANNTMPATSTKPSNNTMPSNSTLPSNNTRLSNHTMPSNNTLPSMMRSRLLPTTKRGGPSREVVFTLKIDTYQGKNAGGSNWYNNSNGTHTRQIDVVRIHQEPDLFILPDFLTNEECDSFLELWRDDVATPHPYATDAACVASMQLKSYNSPLVARIERRIAAAAQCEPSDIKSLEISKYHPQAGLGPHMDSCFKNMIIFLNSKMIDWFRIFADVSGAGGDVAFLRIGLQIHPKRATALMWCNTVEENSQIQNPLMLHCDRPTEQDHKAILLCRIGK